jgi:transcription initiation factor TFIIIB Brf1 subunit/transcription initiation factor TFIIB
MPAIDEVKECPDCASADIIHNDHRQQVICKDCGLIYQELTPMDEERYIGQQHDFLPKMKLKKRR